MLDGVIRQISADAQDETPAAEGAVKRLPELAYRALIQLEAEHLASGGRRLKLVPGMLVTAEMPIGSRSVLDYLLSPICKVSAEAGRER